MESMNGNVIKNSYEPQNLQFIPVRKNMFDTIEIGISEVDGTQAEFVGNKNENTVVTLCFRKRAYNPIYQATCTFGFISM